MPRVQGEEGSKSLGLRFIGARSESVSDARNSLQVGWCGRDAKSASATL